MAEIRSNRAKLKLERNEPVIAVSCSDTDTIDTLGSLGVVDCIWIEMEHGPVTWAQLSDISRACDLWGMTSLVRVNTNEPSVVGRALDRGVQAVLVPHVNTKEEAERVVEGAKRTPLGRRSGSGRQSLGVTDYASKSNDQTMVVALIEDIVAIDNLDEILTVKGVDCFMVVPGDLSHSMGPQYVGKTDHPDVVAVIEKAMKKIVAAGYATGSTANDGNIEHWMDQGGRMFLCNYQGYISNGLHGLRRKVDAKV